MNTTQDWQSLYRVALLETDWTKMEERVRTAESAISQRKRQLSLDHGGSPEENQSIENALRGLEVLRKEALRWSGSKPAGTD